MMPRRQCPHVFVFAATDDEWRTLRDDAVQQGGTLVRCRGCGEEVVCMPNLPGSAVVTGKWTMARVQMAGPTEDGRT